MKFRHLILGIGLLSGCQLAGQEPALLAIDTNRDGLEAIQTTIGQMLNGSNITLADNAFRDQSEVIIERSQNPATPVNQQLGRDFSKPNHFKLWLSKDSCLLEHVETGITEHLNSVRCIPNSAEN